MQEFFNRVYYWIKPSLPRSWLLGARRLRIKKELKEVADRWPIDERAAARPEAWPGWPDQKQFALILTHDVESARGLPRVLELAKIEKEMGFRSAFNFVAQDYPVDPGLIRNLKDQGFEVGVHGLHHRGNLFHSRKHFMEQVPQINHTLRKWEASGFRAPSMYHNLDWIGHLDIEYDMSPFDTDPFEPQPDGVGTIFPFWCSANVHPGYVELPYTLPQDHTLFILIGEKSIAIWKKKLDWIVENEGMVLLITHPDYMNDGKGRCGMSEYPMELYIEFLEYVQNKYKTRYWNPLPREIAGFWKDSLRQNMGGKKL